MTDSAREFLIDTFIPELLKNRSILKKTDQNDYVIKSCQVLPVATDGTFMLSLCNRVKIDLEPVDSDENNLHLDLVIKISPKGLPSRLFERMVKGGYTNEIFVYTKVLPQLATLGYYPRYYYGHVSDQDCSVVLGDFGVDGWRMAPTLVNLSLEHILLAVKCLGKFHGNCYAMKEMNYDEFLAIAGQLKKTRFEEVTTGDELFDSYNREAPQRGIRAVRNSIGEHQIEERYLREVEELLVEPTVLCRSLVQPVEPLATICHGDFLRNNIAFKYLADDLESPADVTMFDFQTMCHTSPMMDLVTFMANSTGVDVRRAHFEEIFGAYHTELINVLCEQLGGRADIPEKYSYDNFLREYLRLLPFGYCVAAVFIPLLHVPLDAPLSFDNEDAASQQEQFLGRGGHVVDRELAGLIVDICELRKRLSGDGDSE